MLMGNYDYLEGRNRRRVTRNWFTYADEQLLLLGRALYRVLVVESRTAGIVQLLRCYLRTGSSVKSTWVYR